MMKSIFSAVGVFAVLGLILGLTLDIRSVDRTSGGYDYPFADWRGETIDFSSMYQTDHGLYKRGYVIDQYFNCTTGMISWHILGLIKGEFRHFSERAIVVHKPQDECRMRGFNADAWAVSELL